MKTSLLLTKMALEKEAWNPLTGLRVALDRLRIGAKRMVRPGSIKQSPIVSSETIHIPREQAAAWARKNGISWLPRDPSMPSAPGLLIPEATAVKPKKQMLEMTL